MVTQAIRTHYIGRGLRIVASTEGGGRVVRAVDHSMSHAEQTRAVAQELADRLH